MSRPVLAMALPFILGGCSTMYPPLYSPTSIAPVKVEGSTGHTEPASVGTCRDAPTPLKQTLSCADVLQSIYSKGYVESAQWNDIAQLPVIGAAGAAAWILLKGKDGAATKAGKIAIGTGVFAATRDQLLPKDMAPTFIKGHAALGCLIAQGDFFDGAAAQQSANNLKQAMGITEGLRADVQELRYLDPVADPKKPYDPELLKAARSIADQAITQSATQLEASATQLGAFEFASPHFRKATTDIAAWVASRGRVRPNAEYKDLLTKFSPPDTTEGVELIDGQSYDGVELTTLLAKKSALLSNSTIRLKGFTPDYQGRLTIVAKCASDLPTS